MWVYACCNSTFGALYWWCCEKYFCTPLKHTFLLFFVPSLLSNFIFIFFFFVNLYSAFSLLPLFIGCAFYCFHISHFVVLLLAFCLCVVCMYYSFIVCFAFAFAFVLLSFSPFYYIFFAFAHSIVRFLITTNKALCSSLASVCILSFYLILFLFFSCYSSKSV